MVQDAVRKSATLIEALPYIQAFAGKIVVVKLGGSAQEDSDVLRKVFTDIAFMRSVGMRPVVIYGGGKRISAAMKTRGLEPVFLHGQRVTTPETMEIVGHILIDEIGVELQGLLSESGATGERLNGRDHRFLRAIKKTLPSHPDADLGRVGEPVAIDSWLVYDALNRGSIPLIAPVACGCGADETILYNVNGDTATALIARDLHAVKVVFLSDIEGIYERPDDPDSRIAHMDRHGAEERIGAGVIAGGMIPKVQACIHALEGGVRKAHIVSGAQPHALLLEIFTQQGVGTEIVL